MARAIPFDVVSLIERDVQKNNQAATRVPTGLLDDAKKHTRSTCSMQTKIKSAFPRHSRRARKEGVQATLTTSRRLPAAVAGLLGW